MNPEVLISTHSCSPQAPDTSEIRSVKASLLSSLVGIIPVSLHTTDTLPSVKVGFNGSPLLSIISIGVGLLVKEIGETRIAPKEAV